MDREFLNDLGAAISNLLLWSKILSGLPVPDKIKYFNADELTEKTEQDAMKNTITVPDAIDLETFLANASEQWEKLHKSPTRKKPALNNYIMTDPGQKKRFLVTIKEALLHNSQPQSSLRGSR
jgi:hypothetical protein